LNIIFQKAKNGEDTVLINQHFIHSSYAPSKEAQRFVDNLELPYIPYAIFILEPALSYITIPLKKRFPQVKIGAIRYTDTFSNYNKDFDFVINLYENQKLELQLERLFKEEEILSLQFFSWQASAQVFIKEEKTAYKAIKASMERAKTLLITRQFFEKKWLLNSVNILNYIKKPVSLKSKIDKALLIIASGPSLKDVIKIVNKKRNSFFIICLSSALLPCIKNNIIPDLCMSTDGGFWAGQHLKQLKNYAIPLALSSEAYCPRDFLSSLNILPLAYPDGISNSLFKASGISYMKAVRNGTVSGTALLWAIENCNQDIFLAGLDMAAQKGFQHIQPNELEKNNAIKETRIFTKAGRLTSSEFNSSSLEIYLKWFQDSVFSSNKKIYRIIDLKQKKNTLGTIQDLDIKAFENMTEAFERAFEKSDADYFFHPLCDTSLYRKNTASYIKNVEAETWKKQLFPLDYLLLSHTSNKEEIINRINKNYNDINDKIKRILYE